MGRYALWVSGLAALTAVLIVGIAAAAGGEETVTVRVGEQAELTAAVRFAPRALSKKSYTPIQASIAQEVRGLDGPAPAERELRLELDRNVLIQTRGLPSCHRGPQTGVTFEEACEGATVGHGEEMVQIAYPENTAIRIPARVLVYNGGERKGAITLYVVGNFSTPVSGTLITEVVFTRIDHGRLGWLAAARLPQITGGYGSLYDLDLTIGRQYRYEGRKASILSARCTDGKLLSHIQASFEGGTSGEAEITGPCTPKD